MGIISIENMEFYAYHGCFEEEQQIGTWFQVDVKMKVDTSKAEQSDNLKDTVNYQAVYHTIRNEMSQKSKLLEHVARRILNALLKNYPVLSAEVTVHKKNPPLGGKTGAVTVTLTC
ncbi:MAG: dihydroneopterin aldolase [Bacteroidales bacterium]|jgi:dihydroneopterin aldolase|nr:dihydroneopterin aldolase [Bacteroidales bacterium]